MYKATLQNGTKVYAATEAQALSTATALSPKATHIVHFVEGSLDSMDSKVHFVHDAPLNIGYNGPRKTVRQRMEKIGRYLSRKQDLGNIQQVWRKHAASTARTLVHAYGVLMPSETANGFKTEPSTRTAQPLPLSGRRLDNPLAIQFLKDAVRAHQRTMPQVCTGTAD